jgi:hypothetical protein
MSENVTLPTHTTAYAAAKYATLRIQSKGVNKTIRPQMMYNYTTARLNEGKNPFIAVNEEGLVSLESVNEWVEKYVAKKLAKVNEVETTNDES